MKTEKTAAAQIRRFFWLLIIFNLRSLTIASVFHTSGRKNKMKVPVMSRYCKILFLQVMVPAKT